MYRVKTIEVYERALRGEPAWMRRADGAIDRLPVEHWGGHDLGSFDSAVLRLCTGPTIDLGCGPGRFVAWLTERGTPALGVDASRLAVRLARTRGGAALHRDLFGQLPGDGRWHHVLLMDGNIGIGADPARLLSRVGELLRPRGTAIVEFDPPGVSLGVRAIRLETRAVASPWFPWAYAGIDSAASLAAQSGFQVIERLTASGRYLAVLERAA